MATAEPNTKRCTKCSETKPVSDFPKDCQKRDGLGSQCRICKNATALAWNRRNKERVRANQARWLVEKAEHRKAWVASHRQKNGERLRAQERARRAAKPEQYREAERQRRQEDLEKARARDREKAARSRATNPERHRRNQRASYKRNPLPWKIAASKRRALLAAAEGAYTRADIAAIFKAQRGRCAYCSKKLRADYDIDHITPLSKGGTNYPSNLQLTCPFCNGSKKDKDPLVYAQLLGRLL